MPRGRASCLPAASPRRLLAFGRLRRVGQRNLELALPEVGAGERERILRGVYRSLAWQLVEFCRMPRYTRENTRDWIRTEGLENFVAAQSRGKGVLVLTGHLGAWELSSFYHSLMGHPMGMVIRRLDNKPLDDFVNDIRCLHGNRVLHKDDFARGLLTSMHAGETVGILMDTNMTPPQGVFAPFFGRMACTASGLARVALRTGAAVLPGFMVVGGGGAEVRSATSGRNLFSQRPAILKPMYWRHAHVHQAIESWIRRYPDQWLWIHRRWKTRPPANRACTEEQLISTRRDA